MKVFGRMDLSEGSRWREVGDKTKSDGWEQELRGICACACVQTVDGMTCSGNKTLSMTWLLPLLSWF